MSLQFIREVVVASTDVPAAASFYQQTFGLEVVDGDPIGGDVLLGVPSSPGGRLRLIATDDPQGEPPAIWDVGARLLGIYSHDLKRTAQAMADAGGWPRTPVTYPYGTASLSELVGRGPDGVWWTIPLAVAGAHRPSAAYAADPDRQHSELHTAVLVVDDHEGAVAFFEAAGLITAFDGAMSGAPFDELVGMPADARLRLAFLVGPDQAPARLEIMSFTGVPTRDGSSSAPVGIRRLVFVADEPQVTHDAMLRAGGEQVSALVVRGPAGVEIEVVGR